MQIRFKDTGKCPTGSPMFSTGAVIGFEPLSAIYCIRMVSSDFLRVDQRERFGALAFGLRFGFRECKSVAYAGQS